MEEEGEARFILRLQQQQHKTNKSTSTKKMPPAAAPIIMARLSSSFLPPGSPTLEKQKETTITKRFMQCNIV